MKYKIRIEVKNRDFTHAWGTYDGIEGYHYTFLEQNAKAFTKEEIKTHFLSRIGEVRYEILEVKE